MATIVLTAVGTALGGPIGGALGALVGQQADRAIFGAGSNAGPRLKELSVTTSSYGQPMPRHFGRMRVGGTVIWATDLVESTSTSGGKGKPKTTTYSYSASFAVALSSTPIGRVGRIWADGNLLRGAADDLKVEGKFRFYGGHGDTAVDPLIAADKGSEAPAFRDCAYVVFEDLQLADFGNRIPALTFEVFAEDDANVSLRQLIPNAAVTTENTPLASTRGFADEGGALSSTLSVIDRVFPLTCATTRDGLRLSSTVDMFDQIVSLPEQLSSDGSEDAQFRFKTRSGSSNPEPLALRYYDEERDYQPGVQRAIGLRPYGQEAVVDLPATMTAEGAKALANNNAHRARWFKENLVWRIVELDPAVQPGSLVKVPDAPGIWRVASWEWYDRGLELGLQRVAPEVVSTSGADAGVAAPSPDLPLSSTHLRVFEVPPEDSTNPSAPVFLAAASSSSSVWHGATLFVEQGDLLTPIGTTGIQRVLTGHLFNGLEPSPALLLEPNATLDVQLVAEDLILGSTNIAGLAAGANRLLVGSEVIQFQAAETLGAGQWRLGGLLRGRAGTEEFAQTPHPSGTPVTLLDNHLSDISGAGVSLAQVGRVGAIGRGDSEAVFAQIENAGLSRRPPVPVHPRVYQAPDATLRLCWTRRARGHWSWGIDGELPLVEQSESYLVGYGPIDTPFAVYSVSEPNLTLDASEQAALVAAHGASKLWVRQVGTYSSSSALFLTALS